MDPTSAENFFPAFKEWAAIVEALGAGEQILLLRKGGIAEGRGGFQVKNQRFWLYPTFFHAQLEESKPAAAEYFARANERPVTPSTVPGAAGASNDVDSHVPRDASSPIALRYFAQLDDALFVDDWSRIQALDAQHLWKESLVRERFDWSKPPGLHVIVVRVFAAEKPHVLTPTTAMLGCKSWVDVPLNFDRSRGRPVLSDAAFWEKRDAIRGILAAR